MVAIPLKEPHPLFGLTEVVDALACARPLILTRAPYFDFDIAPVTEIESAVLIFQKVNDWRDSVS